jgi:hypothetical protein
VVGLDPAPRRPQVHAQVEGRLVDGTGSWVSHRPPLGPAQGAQPRRRVVAVLECPLERPVALPGAHELEADAGRDHTLSFLDFKELGLGMAAAILIDATIIRGVLLPASMRVLGDWNWYLPKWLEWLPRVGEQRGAASPPEPQRPIAGKPGAAEEPQRAQQPV